MLLWRGYDCSVNGVSDAVHHSGVPGRKKGMALNARDKVAWLHDNNLLPLPKHQAYGTVLARVKRRVDVVGADPRRPDETVSVLRSKIEQVHGPVLELARTCGFCPHPDHSADAELATAQAVKVHREEGGARISESASCASSVSSASNLQQSGL